MKCARCGATTYEGAIFCGRCGAAIEGEPPAGLEEARARRRLWVNVIAWTCIAVAAGLVVASLALNVGQGAAAVRVPNVLGKEQAAAEELLKRAGLEPVVGHGKPSSTTPVGIVVEQQPLADTLASSGGRVTIALSVGPGVRVPEVAGLEQDAALSALRRAGLSGTVASWEPSASIGPGLVIASHPAAGSLVEKGSQIRLVGSLGRAPGESAEKPERVEKAQTPPPGVPAASSVPSVTGKSAASAKALLRAAGLGYAVEGKEFSSSVARGHVLSQRPAAGSAPPRNRTVSVTLSLGQGVRVPQVVGKSEAEATAALAQAGLRAVPDRRHAEAPAGQVIACSPKAGDTVAQGSTISLVVSRGPEDGFLRVDAEPGGNAWVYVDGGNTRGRCPVTVRLSPGEHSVILWDPESQKRLSFTVEVKSGTTVSVTKNLG